MSLPTNISRFVRNTLVFKTVIKRCLSSQTVQYKCLDANIGHYYVASVNRRPLVLLFGWMMSHKKHLLKYCNLYISRGFDVLTIQVHPLQIILPPRTQGVIQNLVDYLEDEPLSHRNIVVHGFSVGGYVYSELLVKLDTEQCNVSQIKNRIVGQIFDSPVDMDGIPRGFSNIIVKNRVLKSIMKRSLEYYLIIFENHVTKHYRKGSNAFKLNKFNTPSLMLYSQSDPIGCPAKIESIMDNWERSGVKVYSKSWGDSAHVGHFPKYPDEYVDTLLLFLENCGVLSPDIDISCGTQKAMIQA